MLNGSPWPWTLDSYSPKSRITDVRHHIWLNKQRWVTDKRWKSLERVEFGKSVSRESNVCSSSCFQQKRGDIHWTRPTVATTLSQRSHPSSEGVFRKLRGGKVVSFLLTGFSIENCRVAEQTHLVQQTDGWREVTDPHACVWSDLSFQMKRACNWRIISNRSHRCHKIKCFLSSS